MRRVQGNMTIVLFYRYGLLAAMAEGCPLNLFDKTRVIQLFPALPIVQPMLSRRCLYATNKTKTCLIDWTQIDWRDHCIASSAYSRNCSACVMERSTIEPPLQVSARGAESLSKTAHDDGKPWE